MKIEPQMTEVDGWAQSGNPDLLRILLPAVYMAPMRYLL